MFALIFALLLQQQPEVVYNIAFPNAVHHEAEVSATFTGVPAGVLEVRMSRSSPGRYALHEFAKNVYNVKAFDEAGHELTITRPNVHQWDVSGHHGYVRMTYTLFADHADGTYSGIDNTHAHLNMPATFMFARGMDARPIRVHFTIPQGSNWTVATQLAPTTDPSTFTAPGLQYFYDSPTEISDHDMREFAVTENGAVKRIRLAVHHTAPQATVDSFFSGIQKIVAEQRAVYGELPRYDYGTYTFIADYLPWVFGDGMEHRNSTIVISSLDLTTAWQRLLGTISHEYFHSWNVERIRPKSLEPFDFEHSNMSGELWFAEGFTNYYGPLALERSGLNSIDDFARTIGFYINTVLTAPGRKFFSPVEMAMQAPFVDAATSIDATNRVNTFISYYTYGGALASGLDLMLRTEKQTTLDAFMRAMWRKYGKTEIPYTLNDWRVTLGEVAHDTAWANGFFRAHVIGKEPLDYATLLARGGLLLRKAAPNEASLGPARWRTTADSAHVVLESQTLIGSPLYDAGLDRGDVILTLDGKQVTTPAAVEDIVAGHKPGDRIAVTFEQRGQTKAATLVIAERDQLEIVTYEKAGLPVTAAITRLRAEWLGSKAN